MNVSAAEVARAARRNAGLTQAELAQRLGTTQSSVARLERAGANPTLGTLERVMEATGNVLELAARPRHGGNVDESQIAAMLRRSPAERVAAFESTYEDVRAMAGAVVGGPRRSVA